MGGMLCKDGSLVVMVSDERGKTEFYRSIVENLCIKLARLHSKMFRIHTLIIQ